MVKIFYYCFGSAHSSVVASCLHLGKIPQDRIPEAEEIESLPYYDRTESNQIGTPFFMGIDELGCQVYILGMGSYRNLVKNTIQDIMNIYGISSEEILLVNSLKVVNTTTRIGGFLSRALGWIKIGRPLTIIGVRRNYSQYVSLVDHTKSRIKLA